MCGKKKDPKAKHCCYNCVQRCCCERTKEAAKPTCKECEENRTHPCASCGACISLDKQVCGRSCAMACGHESDERDDKCTCDAHE